MDGYRLEAVRSEGKTTLYSRRQNVLRSIIQPTEHVDLSAVADKTAAEMLAFVREHGLEGIVAKRADSVYQPGKRSGLWAKHRISLGQEFVVGGYVPSNLGLDSLVVGFIAERISYTPPAFEQASSLQPGGRCSRESNTCRPHAAPS